MDKITPQQTSGTPSDGRPKLAELLITFRLPKAGAVGVVCMIGASCRLPAECLPAFAGLPVRAFVHNDPAGMKAARKWAAQLAGAGARVSGFDFSGMLRTDGAAVGDLNDMAMLGADSWEEHRELIENAMRF